MAQAVGAVRACGALYLIASSPGFNPALTGCAANGYGAQSPCHYGLLPHLLRKESSPRAGSDVLGSTDPGARTDLTGVAVGLVLTVTNLVAIPVTNASINPARSLAPALFVGGGAIGQLWLFIVAPLCGVGLAAASYRLSQMQPAVAQRPPRGSVGNQSLARWQMASLCEMAFSS